MDLENHNFKNTLTENKNASDGFPQASGDAQLSSKASVVSGHVGTEQRVSTLDEKHQSRQPTPAAEGMGSNGIAGLENNDVDVGKQDSKDDRPVDDARQAAGQIDINANEEVKQD